MGFPIQLTTLRTPETHPISVNVMIKFADFYSRRKPGPLGQSSIPSPGVRDNRLCRESCCTRERNDGIMEGWNAGFSGMGSIVIRMALISSLNQTVIRFRFPIFHYSTIPLFHSESKVNSIPMGRNQHRALWVGILYFCANPKRFVLKTSARDRYSARFPDREVSSRRIARRCPARHYMPPGRS